MDHEVLIISDPADKSASDMLARRLRALKFAVRNRRAPDRETPTDREIAEVAAAKSVLALWTAASSDAARPQGRWMLAMAQHARDTSRQLVHVTRSNARPGAPFAEDTVHNLRGLTGRKMVGGFITVADTLGTAVSRTGLADWLKLNSNDTVGRSAWRSAHPLDPLSARKPASSRSAGKSTRRQTATPPAITPRTIVPPPIAAQLKPKRFDPSKQPPRGGAVLIIGAGFGAFLLFVAAYLVRSTPLPADPAAPEMPPFAAPCRDNPDSPDCQRVLQPGPIIDDTEDTAAPD